MEEGELELSGPTRSIDLDSPKAIVTKKLGWKRCKAPTTEWNKIQIAWVIAQAILPTAVAFGINYGIGTYVYIVEANTQPYLFEYNSSETIPLSFNFALTLGFGTGATWLATGILQPLDVLNGIVCPILPEAVFWWPAKDSNLEWWLRNSDLMVKSKWDKNRSLWKRLIRHVVKSFPWIIVLEIVFWPIFTGYCWAIWKGSPYPNYPRPEFLLAVLGSVSTFVTAPIWAVMALINLGVLIKLEEAGEIDFGDFGMSSESFQAQVSPMVDSSAALPAASLSSSSSSARPSSEPPARTSYAPPPSPPAASHVAVRPSHNVDS